MSTTPPTRQYHWYQPCVQCTGVSGAEPEGVGEGVELCELAAEENFNL